MDPLSRKRNASDGDSGFDSALSSRSSSISLEDQQEFEKLSKDTVNDLKPEFTKSFPPSLKSLVTADELISEDGDNPNLFSIVNKVTGLQILYKPPSRIKFSKSPPECFTAFSAEEYLRCDVIPRSQLFQARLEYELEKQIEKMELVEVDLNMASPDVKHPPSLGIRVIGVNMIHGVRDKLNIYVKRVLDESVAGQDGRIQVNDQIVEVNGVSLVGVSQKVAANSLSNCSVLPETESVHFLLARPPKIVSEVAPKVMEPSEPKCITMPIGPGVKTKIDHDHPVLEKSKKKADDVEVVEKGENFDNDGKVGFAAAAGPTFEGRSAVRLFCNNERKCSLRQSIDKFKNVIRNRKESVVLGSVVFVAMLILMIPNRRKTFFV